MTAAYQNLLNSELCKPLHIASKDTNGTISVSDIASSPSTKCPLKPIERQTLKLAMPSLYEERDIRIEENLSEDDTVSTSSSSCASLESLDRDEEDYLEDCSYPTKCGVSWSPTIVTQINYRLKTTTEDKELLHYSAADMTRFRQMYKLQIKAAKKLKLEQQKDEEEKRRRQNEENNTTTKYMNPISGLMNMLLSFTESPSQSPASNGNHTSRRSLETTLLIDTLYLF